MCHNMNNHGASQLPILRQCLSSFIFPTPSSAIHLPKLVMLVTHYFPQPLLPLTMSYFHHNVSQKFHVSLFEFKSQKGRHICLLIVIKK